MTNCTSLPTESTDTCVSNCLSTRGRAVVFILGLILGSALLVPAASAISLPPGYTVEEAFPGIGFFKPIQVVYLPDGRRLVVEKPGLVWTIQANGTRYPIPFIDLTTEVLSFRDMGLMNVALDPDFETNRWVYFLYSVDSSPGAADSTDDTFSRLTRYQTSLADSNQVDYTTRQVLIGETWPEGIPSVSLSHTVGALRFGADKSLLVSAGDAASFMGFDTGGMDPDAFGPGKNDPAEDIGAFRARTLNSMCGKILRIDKETGAGLPSNPFWDGDSLSDRSRILIYGLRNPYRFCLRPGTGLTDPSLGNPGVLFIGNTGWNDYNSIYVAELGGYNFGWPCLEGPSLSPYFTVDTTYAGNTNVLCT